VAVGGAPRRLPLERLLRRGGQLGCALGGGVARVRRQGGDGELRKAGERLGGGSVAGQRAAAARPWRRGGMVRHRGDEEPSSEVPWSVCDE
jgi:hypothetical protein